MDGASSTIPAKNISAIKNKKRRAEAYIELKKEKTKTKIKEKKQKKQEAKLLGDDAPPKQVPKTLDNTRVHDETMVNAQDEEVMRDICDDEMASYFDRKTTPKILLTTCDQPCARTRRFCRELATVFPQCTYYKRRALDLKKIIPQAISKDYTDIIVINDNQKIANGLLLTHLPEGPTAHFKLTSVKFNKEIKRSGAFSKHQPELVLNNFNTRLGHSVGRVLASLFPHDPEFHGRRVITFHNQRDFIFFRHHRYQFRNEKRVGLQELGPRFTLKLKSLQKGTFDSKFGEYEWIHKRHEMDTSRRKFHL